MNKVRGAVVTNRIFALARAKILARASSLRGVTMVEKQPVFTEVEVNERPGSRTLRESQE